jgi:hypothetical protein
MLGAHAEGLTRLRSIDKVEEDKQLADIGIQTDPGEVRRVPQLPSTRRRGRSGGRPTDAGALAILACRILPRSISRGRRRCNQEQEKVFHEHAGALFRVDEGGQTGGRGKEASRPPTQFWGRGKQYQGLRLAADATTTTKTAPRTKFEEKHINQ